MKTVFQWVGNPAHVVLDAVPALLAYVDRDQRFQLINDAYRTWLGDQEIIGRTLRDVVGAFTYEDLRPHVEAALDGTRATFETRMPYVHGWRWVHVDYVPHLDPILGVCGFVCQVYDITSRKQAEDRLATITEELREADRRKDAFLALLGHELRNPLAPILTALELMDMRASKESLRERDVIRRQAQHLTRLVDDLLDVSRVTRGKVELRRERVELSAIVGKAIEQASPLLEQRRHGLTVDVARTGLAIDVDPVRMCQVFGNLIANAAKYTEPAGQIAIRARRDADEIVATVRDNGTGISADLLAEVFEPFVQSKQTLDRAQGGLGLGLALVRSLTELHGGIVSAASDGPGTGSTFSVRLPACDVAVPRVPTQPTMPIARPRLHHEKILVVDDNIDAAELLAEALRTRGYAVTVATDAPGALAVATEVQPAFALLDIDLPVMDGYELARHLRGLLPDPLRLIAVTGYGQESDVAKSRAAGFDLHFGKPVDLGALFHALETL